MPAPNRDRIASLIKLGVPLGAALRQAIREATSRAATPTPAASSTAGCRDSSIPDESVSQ
jgi:hypothetical protein